MFPPINHIYFFSLLLAFCSLTYELVFAQVLSVCIGGTKNQYLLTISIFTTSLGLGSLLFGLLKNKFREKNIFFNVEVLLTLFGFLGPFLIVWLLQDSDNGTRWMTIKYFISYFIIFIIGLLSGFELPLLFSLEKENPGKILAYDYIGMLLATILFPLFALPKLGTAGTCLFTATLNQLALPWIRPLQNNRYQKLIVLIIISEILIIIFYKDFFNQLLSDIYLGGV